MRPSTDIFFLGDDPQQDGPLSLVSGYVCVLSLGPSFLASFPGPCLNLNLVASGGEEYSTSDYAFK